MRRLIRLRSTAFPSTRPAVRPTRDPKGISRVLSFVPSERLATPTSFSCLRAAKNTSSTAAIAAFLRDIPVDNPHVSAVLHPALKQSQACGVELGMGMASRRPCPYCRATRLRNLGSFRGFVPGCAHRWLCRPVGVEEKFRVSTMGTRLTWRSKLVAIAGTDGDALAPLGATAR